ncbi:glycosyl transferase, partial [Gardnerella vaginalis]
YSKNNDFKKQAQELIKIYKLAIEMNNNELAKKRAAREKRRARFLLKNK